MLSNRVKRTIATGLSGAAIAGTIGAPAASATPNIDSPGAHRVLAVPAGALARTDPGQPKALGTDVAAPDQQNSAPPQRPTAPAIADATPDAGFDLSSAAIGAAGGTGLLVVVLAAGGLAWRRPITRGHGAAGA
jgi:hypothetical protein